MANTRLTEAGGGAVDSEAEDAGRAVTDDLDTAGSVAIVVGVLTVVAAAAAAAGFEELALWLRSRT
jgi:hypothetical protein